VKEEIMKRSSIIVLVFSIIFILSVPFTSYAEDKKGGYIMLKPGAYFPTGDLKDADFKTGFNGEVVIGTYYNPNLALEFGLGYFESKSSVNRVDLNEKDKFWVVPAIVNFKGVLPFNRAELFAGAGFGVYFLNYDADGFSTSLGKISGDENRTLLGGHVLVGGNVDITSKIFLGIEGKYIVTGRTDIFDSHIKLDGMVLSGNIGYRF
jgi:hypothetical protein